MDGMSEIGSIGLWPAIALAIGWAYLLVFGELRKRNGGDASSGPAFSTSKALAELRSSTLRTPASLAQEAFDEASFLQQAGVAYEFILARYAAGDMERLIGLLQAEVFEAFSRETARRAAAGETMTLEFVGLESFEIVDTEFDETAATVRVRFESELFLSEGKQAVVADMATTTLLRAVDIWTFRREHSSTSPAWILAATDTE